eukprot:scaffold297_cov171-Amphora_coffeaeformis.AAC.2
MAVLNLTIIIVIIIITIHASIIYSWSSKALSKNPTAAFPQETNDLGSSQDDGHSAFTITSSSGRRRL